MYRKKIAIYVEGQTEQVLLNHLILTWWFYSGIHIHNVRLLAGQNDVCPVPNFTSGSVAASDILFLITNVDGVGSLTSAIASRAKAQHQNGFEIIGLRDFYRKEDYCENLTHTELAQQITNNFQRALETVRCNKAREINLFFAVMAIEAWLLAFTNAVSKWARINEEDILKIIHNTNPDIEKIKGLGNLFEKIRPKNRKNHKSYEGCKALVSLITDVDIQKIIDSNCVPSFVRFWKYFLLLSK